MKHAVIIAVLLAGFILLLKGNVIYGPYGYDEGDYMYVASLGFFANYIDSPSLSLPEFAHMGLSARKDPSRRTELAETIRDANDVVFYRHWHGPLYTDWLIAFGRVPSTEQSLRALNGVFPIATALLMYFGALWVIGGAAGQIAAILSAVLYLWSYPAVRANELAPHQLFAFCVTLCLIFLGRLMRTGERRDWYAAVIASALAFCTLEIAFAIIATVIICGLLARDRLKPDLNFGLRSVAAFILTILVVWPGAIMKLSFIKAYAFMAYLALFQKKAWGSDISVAGAWWMRMWLSPVPWILLLLAIGLVALRRVKWSPILFPPAVFFVSMFLAIFRVNADAPRYALPILPGLVLLGAWTTALWLIRFRASIRAGAIALTMAAMFLTTERGIRMYPLFDDPKSYAMVNLIREKGITEQKLLVPHDYLPMIHYYFPRTHLTPYRDLAAIRSQLGEGSFQGVIYEGDPPRYQPAMAVH